MSGASSAQIGAIHALAGRIGLTQAERRAFIARQASGKTSCRQLSGREAVRVIDGLKALQGGRAKGAADLAGPYAAKLRALWLSGWHLGVVRDRTDTALLAFLERQTGLEHTRFLSDAASARRVIEALKAWLAREGGVEWPAGSSVDESKRAVWQAQRRRMAALGLDGSEGQPGADVDVEIRATGAVIRRRLKRQAKAGGPA
ncbi:Mu-like prophage protein gp16 [Azorhizobium caulinodans ORS 571]|uniref:Mu-like prophage protein gp16 n=1 Tax=Azorhizobium caulinodans (strain ATCC 43989 / DSM 5975 / JCM 20966 / LMG 6465 / NBRC 14845 / NCIMB 13405 / ORS 571) TaxID=438753 RepID=A8I7L1_AZOC5|nr:regulatory protein GemA [Azorhizobium caulinodans]BAF88132.1 Mu-like prophage protein gp16 [Azorhizobium caulinodans ORS 571]